MGLGKIEASREGASECLWSVGDSNDEWGWTVAWCGEDAVITLAEESQMLLGSAWQMSSARLCSRGANCER